VGASKNFASQAVGKAFVVLNGSREIGAIKETSFFYTIELPLLDASKVDTLKVLLLHDVDMAKHETCSQPKSLLKLIEILKIKSINYECEDNPDNVVLTMCFKNPLSPECQSIVGSAFLRFRSRTR
jgi:hypothetical protein